MKTAEEWIQEFDDNTDGITSWCVSYHYLKQFILKIQADASKVQNQECGSKIESIPITQEEYDCYLSFSQMMDKWIEKNLK